MRARDWPRGRRGDCRSVRTRRRRGPRADDPRRRAVPHDARQLGDERLDRDGREGRRHDGDRHPGRDHGLHARDGGADDHRRQGRRDHRPQAGVRDRLRHLRLRLAHHVARAEPARPAVRLVVPRGCRRGADHARDRRPRRVELRAGAPAGGLRDGRRRRRDRRRGRPADRRLLHDLLLVALGLRGRGRRRARDPRRSRARSRTRRPRRGRSSTSSARILSAAGLGALVFGVLRSSEWGWIQPKPGGAVVGGALADGLADPDRRCSSCGSSSAGRLAGSRGARRRSSVPAFSATASSAAA